MEWPQVMITIQIPNVMPRRQRNRMLPIRFQQTPSVPGRKATGLLYQYQEIFPRFVKNRIVARKAKNIYVRLWRVDIMDVFAAAGSIFVGSV